MSAQATQDDGSTELPTDEIHGKLASRLQELRNCVDRADDSYYMDVEKSSEKHGTWSVTIDSDDWVLNEGEIGDMHFHIILGPQGGLRVATHNRTLGGKKDYIEDADGKQRAWKHFRMAIKRAK